MRLLSGATSGFDSKNLTGFSSWLARSSSQPDFPALRGAAQASEREPKTSDGSGRPSLGSFATWNPASSSWNAPQASLLEDSNTFSGPWPTSGSMRNGTCYERPTSAPRIRGRVGGASGSQSDSGAFYPTPTASEYGTNQGGSAGRTGPVRESLSTWARDTWATPAAADSTGTTGGGQARSLRTDVSTWATPTAMDANDPVSGWGDRKLCREATLWSTPTAAAGGKGADSSQRREGGDSLTGQSANWPTPRARAGTRKRSRQGALADVDRKGGAQDLEAAVALWPTPVAADGERSSATNIRGNPTLAGAARAHWPTPTAGDSQGSGGRKATGGKTHAGTSLTDAALASRQVPATTKPGHESSPLDLSLPRRSQEPTNRRLSALFVAWLMGWWRPSAETCSDSSETASSRSVRSAPSRNYSDD